MISSTPQLIVLTPIRNEAWILKAFLTATSLWADRIIIVDQMSTDGSREIALQFSKVTLIDNTNPEMHMARTRHLLFEEANKIAGEKILFALDADEFLAGDFMNSADWHTIMNSQIGDVFDWKWMNLYPQKGQYTTTSEYYYWACHVGDSIFEGEFPDRNIHEWRLPWPKDCHKEYCFEDLHSLHFARVNSLRQKNKERFYQVSSLAPNEQKRYTNLSLYRQYHSTEHLTFYPLPSNSFAYYEQNGLDIYTMIDFQDEGKYYTEEIIRYITRDGAAKYALLDIWDKDWCLKHNMTNPQKWYHRMILSYLKHTQNKHHNFFIHVCDKLLKLTIAQ